MMNAREVIDAVLEGEGLWAKGSIVEKIISSLSERGFIAPAELEEAIRDDESTVAITFLRGKWMCSLVVRKKMYLGDGETMAASMQSALDEYKTGHEIGETDV